MKIMMMPTNNVYTITEYVDNVRVVSKKVVEGYPRLVFDNYLATSYQTTTIRKGINY